MEIEIGDHPDRLPSAQCIRFAAGRARQAPAGVGAFVTESRVAGDRHEWTVAISDGHVWSYIYVWGAGLSRWTHVNPTLVARAVEAAVPRRVPPGDRIGGLRRRGPVRVTPASLGITGQARGDGPQPAPSTSATGAGRAIAKP
ncbi:hypothetical protein [Baekduia sp. Peel2402]|uniref:hypothetical protein n=1 Tax=Baekduia sp. Peel2402 TaxID=3458296 RepID=UPI00403EA8E1